VDRWPGLNRNFAAIHARQRSLTDICASLARQLSLTAEGYDGSVGQLLARITERAEPPSIVIDALDEAEDHQEVLDRLLLPLAQGYRPDGRPTCRLLVSMRPWTEFDEFREFADALGGLTDLDQIPMQQVRYDLENYISDLLRGYPPYDEVEYAGTRQTFAASVARTLTSGDDFAEGKQWGEFLVAGLYARHLVTAHEPIQDLANAAELGSRAPRSLPELLELDLSARTGLPWLRPMLAALAHARGEGMPARTAGNAASAFHSPLTAAGPNAHEIAETLKAARFYLRQATDIDGTTLYRLFHQGLADYLQSHPTTRDFPDQKRHGFLNLFLLKPLGSADRSGRRWDIAEPYLLRHAVHHAIDAIDTGAVHRLAEDVEFLVHADIAAVKTLLDQHPLNWLTGDDFATLATAKQAASNQGRRQLLALLAARAGATEVARRLANPPGRTPLRWQPLWAIGDQSGPAVSAIAAAKDQPLVAIGHADGSIVLRDCLSGRTISIPPHGPDAEVAALALGRSLGRLLLASITEDGRLKVYNGETGTLVVSHQLWPPPGWLDANCLELTTIAGRLAAVRTEWNGNWVATDIASGEDLASRAADTVGMIDLSDTVLVDDAIVELVRYPASSRCFTTGGNTLIAAADSDWNLIVRDIPSKQAVDIFPMPAPVKAITTTSDGDLLVLVKGNAIFFGRHSLESGTMGARTIEAPETNRADP
jgi:hypothetical protein